MLVNAKMDGIHQDFETEYFQACGIKNINTFLNPVFPFNIKEIWKGYLNLDKGWDLIHKHYQGKIAILCDTDMDGLLSATLLARYLYEIFNIDSTFLYHFNHEKHGITSEIVELLEKNPVDLLIIPDAGSGNKDIQRGEYLINYNYVKDILVLDHHQVKAESPQICMINCTQGNTNPYTSGTGVVWHFLQYHAETYGVFLFEDSLSYVAFSLISDICDLSIEDNYRFIHYGLQLDYLNPTLSYIWDILRVNISHLNPTQITWNLVPKINALFRYNEQEDREMLQTLQCLLIEDDIPDNLTFCSEIVRHMNRRHKQQQKDIVNWVEEIESQLDLTKKVLIVNAEKYSDRFYGLIASKLEGKYHKPILVISYQDELWRGSVRTSNLNFFQYCIDSGLFEYVDGHPEGAFGIGFEAENSQKIINYFEQLDLTQETIYPVTLSFNNIQSIEDLPYELFSITEKYQHVWGKNIEEPTIAIYRIFISGDKIQEIGRNKTTIKFFYNGIWFIKFFCSNEWKKANHIGEKVDLEIEIIGTCTINNYKGIITNEIKIKEMFTHIATKENELWTNQF